MSYEGEHSGEDYKGEIARLDDVTLSAKFSVVSDALKTKYDFELQNAKQNVNLKGFRKGKAPKAMVEKLYGPNIIKQASDDLMQKVTLDLIKTKEIPVVGYPEVDIKKLEVGSDFEFEIKIAIAPDPEITDYDKFEVEIEKADITDDAVNREVELILEANATDVSDEKAKLNDEHTFEALIRISEGDVANEGNSFDPYTGTLESKDLPAELLQKIKGLGVDEEVSLALEVSADFVKTEIAGKPCFYEFQLKKLTKKVLPELTDDFVKNLDGFEAETVLELKKFVREEKEKQEQQLADQQADEKILEELINRNSFEVPQAMIDDEIKNMLANYGLFNSGQQDPRTFNVAPFRDNLGAPAKQRIQTSIAVDKIADKEKIEVEDSEVEEKYQTIATSAGVDVETVKNHYKTNNGGEMLKLEIRRDKVLELLKSRSKVKFVAKKAEPEVKEEEKTE